MSNRVIAFGALVALTACQRRDHTSAETHPPTNPAARAAPEALDQLDTRAPVPLLPMMAHHQKQNMRDHLVAIRDIVRGLADHDDRAVEEAARRISYSDEMGQMCTRMGAGAPGFAEQSIRFHHTADDIVEAANRHDRAGVLRELSATLQACTACHAVWKQRVVDVATWQRPTAHEAADDRAR